MWRPARWRRPAYRHPSPRLRPHLRSPPRSPPRLRLRLILPRLRLHLRRAASPAYLAEAFASRASWPPLCSHRTLRRETIPTWCRRVSQVLESSPPRAPAAVVVAAAAAAASTLIQTVPTMGAVAAVREAQEVQVRLRARLGRMVVMGPKTTVTSTAAEVMVVVAAEEAAAAQIQPSQGRAQLSHCKAVMVERAERGRAGARLHLTV